MSALNRVGCGEVQVFGRTCVGRPAQEDRRKTLRYEFKEQGSDICVDKYFASNDGMSLVPHLIYRFEANPEEPHTDVTTYAATPCQHVDGIIRRQQTNE